MHPRVLRLNPVITARLSLRISTLTHIAHGQQGHQSPCVFVCVCMRCVCVCTSIERSDIELLLVQVQGVREGAPFRLQAHAQLYLSCGWSSRLSVCARVVTSRRGGVFSPSVSGAASPVTPPPAPLRRSIYVRRDLWVGRSLALRTRRFTKPVGLR